MSLDGIANFAELLGEHILTGVDMDSMTITEGYNKGGRANLVRFILDGITWEAVEDPEDGYRSCMDILQRADVPVKNTFPPCRIVGSMHARNAHEGNKYVDLIDAATGKIVLSVGTANTNDYYPWFVGYFDPTAMSVNQKGTQSGN